jgi:hydroxyethylthiazole kinase-like uncharacterized protein yjeF
LTREQSRQVDADAVQRLGVQSLILMENAGRGATDVICERFPERLGRVVLLGGTGQNGGDAWVVARRVRVLGHQPLAVLLGDPARLRGDAKTNWMLLQALGVETEVLALDDLSRLAQWLGDATLLVDGLFGTGLDRPLEGGYADAVAALDAVEAPLVSLDLPSGIDANTGAVLGAAPHAVLTVTFAAHKRGLHQYPGVAHAGEVRLVDIGVPAQSPAGASLWREADLAQLIEPRAADAHKGQNGHLLLVAGSPGTTGAAVLAGMAGLRAGAGLVTLAARADARSALEQKVVELMTTELPAEASRDAVERLCAGKRAVVLGPGLGLDAQAARWTEAFLDHAPVPLLVDADALTLLAHRGIETLGGGAGPRILTPHPGEAARLLGGSSAEIQADRYAAAAELARRSGQIAVLKGARSLVATEDELRVCAEGTPALGVAGTGDVLSGTVGALAMQTSPVDAAIAGVLLHALAGLEAACADRGLVARDVVNALPTVIGRFAPAR